MPLFLQALPLSLRTFWRYLAILPILGIVSLLLLLAAFLPVVGYFVPGTVAAYCVMTGLRCALAARGHESDPGFGYLLRAGLVFSLLTIVAGLVIQAVAVVMPIGLYSALGWMDGLVDNDPRIVGIAGSVFGLYLILMLLWGAAIAVPMTAAVAWNGKGFRGIDPFTDIGAGMFSLGLISLVWVVGGSFWSFFGEIATMFFLLVETIRAVASAEDPAWDWSLSPLSLLGGTLWMAWASSWFFATAVLVWERRVERRRSEALARVEATRVSAADLRALREARTRGDRGPV